MVRPAVKREAVAHLQARLGLSERRACRLVGADQDDPLPVHSTAETELRKRLRDLANERRRFGYRRLFVLLRRDGEPWHRPHLSAVSRRRAHGAQTPRGSARPWEPVPRSWLRPAQTQGGRWISSMINSPVVGGFRILNVVDDVTRECLAAIPDTSISGRRVAQELTALIERRGSPDMIVSDNGATGQATRS